MKINSAEYLRQWRKDHPGYSSQYMRAWRTNPENKKREYQRRRLIRSGDLEGLSALDAKRLYHKKYMRMARSKMSFRKKELARQRLYDYVKRKHDRYGRIPYPQHLALRVAIRRILRKALLPERRKPRLSLKSTWMNSNFPTFQNSISTLNANGVRITWSAKSANPAYWWRSTEACGSKGDTIAAQDS